MRDISVKKLEEAVYRLFLESNYYIGKDIRNAIHAARNSESSLLGKAVLDQIAMSYEISARDNIAICQDTGMAVIFIDIGQEVHFTEGDFKTAINSGVRKAYETGYLRKSVVDDPLFARVNTLDNTPAIIHSRIIPGEQVLILVTAKGFGSENMSRIKMLLPGEGIDGVKKFVVETVEEGGPNPCPPIIVGVGIGGTFETAALMAKRCTARDIDSHNADPRYAALEEELLVLINQLGIGPAGIGGRTTALKVNIDYYPTHIAGLPVAVNICCHAARHAETIL